jgi:hypothetical protein
MPPLVSGGEIVFCVDAARRRLVCYRYSDRNSGSERAELLEPLGVLEWMRRETDPLPEGVPRICVHSDVLEHLDFDRPDCFAIANERNACAGKIERTSVITYDNFHEVRVIRDFP